MGGLAVTLLIVIVFSRYATRAERGEGLPGPGATGEPGRGLRVSRRLGGCLVVARVVVVDVVAQ